MFAPRYESPGLVFARGLSLGVPIFLFFHVSLFIDAGSLSVPPRRPLLARFLSNVGLIDRIRFQTSSPSHRRIGKGEGGFRRKRRIIRLSDFTGGTKARIKSALSYYYLPERRLTLALPTVIPLFRHSISIVEN